MRLASVGSTMDAASALPVGTAVVADEQTAGRGRLDRRWDAPAGTALLASVVLAPRALAMPRAAVAAAEACGPAVRLKWPNDLMAGGRQAGGIIAEARAGRVILGFGINLTWAPDGAAALGLDRDELLEALLAGLRRWWEAATQEVLDAWRSRLDTLGRRVRVELPGGAFEGIAEDVDSDGSLRVSGRRFAAGDVIHLR